MPARSLATWLIERAKDARAQLLEDDLLALRETFTVIRAGAELATGDQRDLLEVAEAFFAPLARNQLSRQQIELREFVRLHGEAAEGLLHKFLDEKSISLTALPSGPAEFRRFLTRLQDIGVLIERGAYLSISPMAEPVVRELMDPLAFRVWARVEQVRREAEAAPEDQRPLVLAGQLGVTEAQAKRFLRRWAGTKRGPTKEPAVFEVPKGGLLDQESSTAFGRVGATLVSSGEIVSVGVQNTEKEPGRLWSSPSEPKQRAAS